MKIVQGNKLLLLLLRFAQLFKNLFFILFFLCYYSFHFILTLFTCTMLRLTVLIKKLMMMMIIIIGNATGAIMHYISDSFDD